MFKSKKIIVWGIVFLLVLTILTQVIGADVKQSCINSGGTYVGAYPHEYCYNAPYPNGALPDEIVCPEGSTYISLYSFESGFPSLVSCSYVNLGGSMEKDGRCKFFTVDDTYLGGTVSVTGLGAPNILRLKNANGIYKLPVVLSSVERNDETGVWSAEFATIDPLTSQPLVPPGTYNAGCFGANGTADGFGLEVTITR